MISVESALENLFALVQPLASESIALARGLNRVLAAPVVAGHDQPPFATATMDGYAITVADAKPGDVFEVIGAVPAGHIYDGPALTPTQALRIFTGAPVPAGVSRVVIQEDVTPNDAKITLSENLGSGANIRALGADFARGAQLAAPRRLSPFDLALAAAMNAPELRVTRRPKVALIATGDELIWPGETLGPGQIIASNTFGLAALFEEAGADVQVLPIARDNRASLAACFEDAAGADLIVTIGGASVGDHDVVALLAEDLGLERAFYKVAMRPGKPLMAGRFRDAMMIGLPGNPVSAMACGVIFVRPVIRAMLGLPARAEPPLFAPLGHDMPANGPRAHYMRARVQDGAIAPFEAQDSALLRILSEADALLIRPPHAAAAAAGDIVPFIPLR